MKFCINCGNQLNNEKFCPKCGAPTGVSKTPPPPTGSYTPPTPIGGYETKYTTHKHTDMAVHTGHGKPIMTAVLAVILAVVFAAAGCVGGIVMTKNGMIPSFSKRTVDNRSYEETVDELFSTINRVQSTALDLAPDIEALFPEEAVDYVLKEGLRLQELEDFKINYEIVDTIDADEDYVEELNEMYEEINLNITAAKLAEVELSVSGLYLPSSIYIVFGEIGDSWYIVSVDDV